MSIVVQQISNVVLLLSNPSWDGVDIIRNITALNGDLAYSSQITDNITVLSSRFIPTLNGAIQGLLYLPDLLPDDPCVEVARQYIPDRVVTQASLPVSSKYNLIALVPWIDVNCTKSFLASARQDPLRALIFYRPGALNDSEVPANSPLWSLNDEGRWKTQSHFPIFAVPSAWGWDMMNELSLYSGNLSQVPNGDVIINQFKPDPSDYVRIWTQISVATPQSVPSIWMSVVIIVAALLFIVLGTSFLMHIIQGRRRASLRRRVMAGEVDLEAMGIRRLTVPLAHVEKFPLFTYHYEPEKKAGPEPPASPTTPPKVRTRGGHGPQDSIVTTTLTSRALSTSDKSPVSPTGLSTIATDYQPECLICLEPYENRISIIRELPCGHIFHPECIDEFLSRHSSLCPICKTNMLPVGYAPAVTNGMVRRERAMRKLRDRIDIDDDREPSGTRGRIQSWGSSIKKRIWIDHSASVAANDIELRPTVPAQGPSYPWPPDRHPGRASPTSPTRRRMRELAGRSPVNDDRGHAIWQRVRHRIFPGF